MKLVGQVPPKNTLFFMGNHPIRPKKTGPSHVMSGLSDGTARGTGWAVGENDAELDFPRRTE